MYELETEGRPIKPGDDVRIDLKDSTIVFGRVKQTSLDTLTIEPSIISPPETIKPNETRSYTEQEIARIIVRKDGVGGRVIFSVLGLAVDVMILQVLPVLWMVLMRSGAD